MVVIACSVHATVDKTVAALNRNGQPARFRALGNFSHQCDVIVEGGDVYINRPRPLELPSSLGDVDWVLGVSRELVA